jgi:uncharacterized protein YegL
MTKQNYTHLVLIVDRSGSMENIAADMNGSIRTLLREQSEVPGDITVDVVTFDNEIETPYTDVDPLDVQEDVIVPRGSTALNDAVGSTIVRLGEKFKNMDETMRPDKVIICICTDGMENASREYTTKQVQAMVSKQREEWQWEFIFLAANIDAFATGRGYGFAKGSTQSYAATPQGVADVYATASAGITRSRLGGDTTFTEAERQSAGSTP